MPQEIARWTTGRLLVTAARQVERAWEEVLHRHNVSHAGFTILDCLQDGPLPQRGLARACRVTDQTISRSIERLQWHGLVTRETDPSDERRQLVSITLDGETLRRRVTEELAAGTVISGAVREPERLRSALVELVEGMDSRSSA